MKDDASTPTDDPIQNLRGLLIRIVFWSLGLAALLGVVGVLTGSYMVGLRASGTALLTATAAGLLWSVGSLDPKHQQARYVGLATTLLSYLMFMVAIWLDFAEDKLAVTGTLTAIGGVIAVVGFLLLEKSRTFLCGLVVVATTALLWFTGLIGLWTQDFWDLPRECVVTWFLLAWSALVAAICLIDIDLSARSWWRWLGVAGAVLSFGIGAAMTWDVIPEDEQPYMFALTAAILVGHANLILLAPLGSRLNWLKWATIATAIFTGLGINIITLAGGHPGEFVVRMTAAASILSGVGTLAIVILTLYMRPRSAETRAEGEPITSIAVICPSCGSKQELSLNGDECKSCGLGIDVRIRRDAIRGDTIAENVEPLIR